MYKRLYAPLVVQVEITTMCPNRCLHCYNSWRNSDGGSPRMDISSDGVSLIIEELIFSKVFHVVLTGGEPLANKDSLFGFLETAATRGLTVGINSSLIGLTRKDAQQLKILGVSSVLTSVMGHTAEIHDRIAQRDGAFSLTISGIKLLQEVGVPVFVNMVVSKENIRFLRPTVSLVKSLGIKHFSSTRAGCPGNCSDFTRFSLSLDEFREYLKILHSAGDELGISVGVLESYPLCAVKEIDRYESFIGRRCMAGVTTVTIGATGDVRPCSHLDVSYGNIFTESLPLIWEKMSEWRSGDLLPQDCKECAAFAWCGGGCRMESKMRNQLLTAPDPYRSLADIPYVVDQLKRKPQALPPIDSGVLCFKLNPRTRWRFEEFGGVVFVGYRFALYLNMDAMLFIDSLAPNTLYVVDPSNPIDPSFLEKLLAKGVILQCCL